MEQLTITEIADRIAIHRTSALRRARKERWPFVERPVRGGKERLYPTDQLPKAVQTALALHNLIDSPAPETNETKLADSRKNGKKSVGQTQPVCNQSQEEGRFKADLLALYNRALASADWGGKVTARLEFEQAYNSGLTWPHLYEQLGPLSWKTLDAWAVKVRRNNNDCFLLADKRGAHLRGTCGLTEEQTEIFLRCVLRPNSPRISEAYRLAKAVMEQKEIEPIHSEATYRRWLRRWKERNYHLWVFARKGAKAWNDQCAMYLERNMDLLSVGDVIVADGHSLNFEIVNPAGFAGNKQPSTRGQRLWKRRLRQRSIPRQLPQTVTKSPPGWS